MAENGEPEKRLVRQAPASRQDLIHIYGYTFQSYGSSKADGYAAFLIAKFELLALYPGLGTNVEGLPGIRSYVAKINGRAAAHGHRILYREVSRGIEIIRVIHTRVDWRSAWS